MGKSLREIAESLKDSPKKVQLIYAFNGVGKTRLSREFKELIDPPSKKGNEEEEREIEILYYNAFTEDLFYWDNDLDKDKERKLIIRSNNFTQWILEEEGKSGDVIKNFQSYTNDKITPIFAPDYLSVSFSFAGGNEESINNIKISKGEESNFIWCVFYSLLSQVIEVLNNTEDRPMDKFDNLKYIFIDDPVTSLDDNHLIQLAVDLAEKIKKAPTSLKFVITTHNALFYNVLYNELGIEYIPSNSKKIPHSFLLDKNDDGSFDLEPMNGDSNPNFSYHLHIKNIIEKAVNNNQVEKYHFVLLRNLYEKTASFLGYESWKGLLPGDQNAYYYRIIQYSSHSTLSGEEASVLPEPLKKTVGLLLNHLITEYNYWTDEASNEKK